MNFNQPPHLFEASIRQFITDVCSQNLIHLDERLHSISASSKEMSGRREAIEKMQTAFRQAIEMKHFRKGVWNNLTEGEIPVRPVPAICHENSTIPKVAVDRLRKAGFSEEQAKIATSVLWKLMVSEFNLPSKETSHEVALGTANLHYSSFITKEQRRRQRPANEPSLQIEIKRIVSKILKDGREKKNWGVEIHINGEVFPVNFGSKDRLMIYICSLLRIKLGEHLYIHEFYNNSKGRKSRFKRGSSRKWLKAAFEVLFPSMDRTFDEWIRNIETAKGRPLNQGKTQAANLIEVALDTQPDGIYYCTLYTKEDEAHDSYYHIRIKPEQIIVPQELSFLIDDFYEMTDTQPVSNYHPME